MSPHYLVKHETVIDGTQSAVSAISATLIKFLRHTVRQAKK